MNLNILGATSTGITTYYGLDVDPPSKYIDGLSTYRLGAKLSKL